MSSLRERVLNAKDKRSEVFTSEEWGTAKVVSLSQKEKNHLVRVSKDENGVMDNDVFGAGLIIATFFDPETDKPAFTPADRDALLEKGSVAFEKALECAMRVCGFTVSENAEKNSVRTERGDTSSVSLNASEKQ